MTEDNPKPNEPNSPDHIVPEELSFPLAIGLANGQVKCDPSLVANRTYNEYGVEPLPVNEISEATIRLALAINCALLKTALPKGETVSEELIAEAKQFSAETSPETLEEAQKVIKEILAAKAKKTT